MQKNIEKSKIIIQFPFEYDQNKITISNEINLHEELFEDFLPYTKNFFKHKSKDYPCVIEINDYNYIKFTNIKNHICEQEILIDKINIYFFEKKIAILKIEYLLPENINYSDFLIYHHCLTKLKKQRNQKTIDSKANNYNYYEDFIKHLINDYGYNELNIFNKSNLNSYNLIISKQLENDFPINSFIVPLVQYRNKLENIESEESIFFSTSQIANIKTYANENIVLHFAQNNDDFIKNSFMDKYTNNHYLTYLIVFYQVCKIQQLIVNTFLDDSLISSSDFERIRNIKTEILYFMSNINFSKISNNSIRNNLYKFYKKAFEIELLSNEVKEVSEKITNDLENKEKEINEKKRNRSTLMFTIISLFLAIITLSVSKDFIELIEKINPFKF